MKGYSKILFAISFVAVFMMSSCNKKKMDISGMVQGVWKTDWSESKAEDGFEDMEINEQLALISDNEAGSAGKFRQVFQGTATYVGPGSQTRVAFAVIAGGDWSVKDVNDLVLVYNLDNMSIAVGKPASGWNKADTGEEMLSGDWDDPVVADLGSGTSGDLSSDLESQVKSRLSNYFRNQFREINKDKGGLKNVGIEGKMMTVKRGGGLMGKEDTYYKAEIDVDNLNRVSGPHPVQNTVDVAPLHPNRGNDNGLPNYDWLSSRYVTYSDIQNLSGSQRRIMRNYIYARHGYRFRSDDLSRYFSQYSWYSPLYSDVSGALNSVERANVQFILSYE